MMPPAGFLRSVVFPDSYTLRYMTVIGAGATVYLPTSTSVPPVTGFLKLDALFTPHPDNEETGMPVAGWILDLVAYCEPATTSAIDTVLQFKAYGMIGYVNLVSWPRTGGTALIVQGYRLPALDAVRFMLTNSGVLQTRLCWWATFRNG